MTDAEIAAAFNETRNIFIGGGGVVPRGFVIDTVSRNAAGDLSLSFVSEAGREYSIQYSETLQTWTDIASITGDGSTVTFTDDDAARIARDEGYYRIVLLP